jgi:hypothetical protein
LFCSVVNCSRVFEIGAPARFVCNSTEPAIAALVEPSQGAGSDKASTRGNSLMKMFECT